MRHLMCFSSKSFSIAFAALMAFQSHPAGKFELTIDNIMRGPGLVGYEPTEIRWSGDSEHIYFRWKQASEPVVKDFDTYVVNRDGSGLRKLDQEEENLAPPATGVKTRDKRLTVYARSGDVFVYDSSMGETRRITKTAEVESTPRFLRDATRISFMRANNLYVMSLDGG